MKPNFGKPKKPTTFSQMKKEKKEPERKYGGIDKRAIMIVEQAKPVKPVDSTVLARQNQRVQDLKRLDLLSVDKFEKVFELYPSSTTTITTSFLLIGIHNFT